MKKTIMTVAMLAFLMGGFNTVASAKENTNSTKTEIKAGDKWDKLLDEYEQLVDQYIKVYKKAKSGDAAAMNEYAKLAEKAQKVAAKLEKAKGQLSQAQLKRMAKIATKMANAMLN